jgi:hypothetical protein
MLPSLLLPETSLFDVEFALPPECTVFEIRVSSAASSIQASFHEIAMPFSHSLPGLMDNIARPTFTDTTRFC